jgi:hypothetical protein
MLRWKGEDFPSRDGGEKEVRLSKAEGSSIRLGEVAARSGGDPVLRPGPRVHLGRTGRTARPWRRVSVLLRRTHMYLGLFVTPWLMMYALSTIIFNHAAQVDRFYQRLYGPHFDQYVLERQLSYDRIFPQQATLRTRAEEILADLHLNGSFGVETVADRLVITRRDPWIPRRITLDPGTHRLVIERQNSRVATFLTTLHTQVSYANQLQRIKAWALSVDMTIATMLILVFSGLWMWWELKVTRLLGSLFLLLGVLLFGLFLFLA